MSDHEQKKTPQTARPLLSNELGFTQGPLEMAGHYVRTARREEDMSGRIIAEFTFHNPRYKADAQLFIAAQDLLKVAMLLLETATIETPMELLCLAHHAIKQATTNVQIEGQPAVRLPRSNAGLDT